MPDGAKFLHAAAQHGHVTLWFLCDATAPIVRRKFFVCGTGHNLIDDGAKYLGTVLLYDDSLVLHVFETEGKSDAQAE